MKRRIILVIAPGRTDRAFYKAFIMKIFRDDSRGNVVDLDKDEYKQSKEKILREVFPLPDDNNLIKRLASLRVILGNSDEVYVFIIPSESNVTEKSAEILSFLSGVEHDRNNVDAVIVAEDAEKLSFKDKLNSLYNSLLSNGAIVIDKELNHGKYFRYYSLKKPRGMKLVLLTQGLDNIRLAEKRAIEDFIIYLFSNELQSKLLSCVNALDIKETSNVHKKLALLIALSKCYNNIESFFFESLTKDHVELLRKNHDGLNKIIELIQEI